MRARHVVEGDGFSILASHPHLTVASIVSEAVLNADDNPKVCKDNAEAEGDKEEQRRALTTTVVTVVGVATVRTAGT